MTYKDRSWCAESKECFNGQCDRRLSNDEYLRAYAWWNRGTTEPTEPVFSFMSMKDTDMCIGFKGIEDDNKIHN
jgi:hypothetical protein